MTLKTTHCRRNRLHLIIPAKSLNKQTTLTTNSIEDYNTLYKISTFNKKKYMICKDIGKCDSYIRKNTGNVNYHKGTQMLDLADKLQRSYYKYIQRSK